MAAASVLPEAAGGVDLREQQRLEGRVEAEVLPVLDGLQGVLVEQLEDGRHQPLSGALSHGLPGVDQVVERADDGAGCFRSGRPQPQGHLGDHAERPLGPDEQAGQVQTAHALGRTPTEAHRRAVCAARSADDGLEPEDVVAGDAVLEAAQAAGIGRDVAADGRPRRARRVGRVPEPFGGDGGLEVVVDDARLDDDDLVVGVDLQDPVQAGDVEDQAAVGGVRAAGQSGAGAARDDRDVEVGAGGDCLGHLIARPGAEDRHCQSHVGPRGLVMVEARDDVAVGDELAVR